jgi:glutathione S-transferase
MNTFPSLVLVSHALCPYVQRAAIVLAEKQVPFERRDVDLSHKPDWFLAISPLGKTPLLLVNPGPAQAVIFESAVICEYLDETHGPRLHPEDALTRAQHRSWIEFASATLNSVAGFYSASDEAALESRRLELRRRFEQLEAVLQGRSGRWFGGPSFALVDAAFAPVFRYFDVFEQLADFRFFEGLNELLAWRVALAERASVRQAVVADYAERLMAFLRARPSALGQRARQRLEAVAVAESA